MLNKKNNLIKYLFIAVVVLIAFAITGKKMGWIGGVANQKVAVEKVSLRTIVETVSASGKIQPEISAVSWQFNTNNLITWKMFLVEKFSKDGII